MRKRYSSREVIKIITKDGWYKIHQVGSHKQFKHPTKPGKVTVTDPVKDIPIKTLSDIERQSGIKFP